MTMATEKIIIQIGDETQELKGADKEAFLEQYKNAKRCSSKFTSIIISNSRQPCVELSLQEQKFLQSH